MTDQIPTVPMLDTKQAARVMNMDANSIRRLCRLGRIPGAVNIGNKWLINRAKFLAYLGIEE